MSATLELVLDASGMQRGAQQATKALDDVSAKAGTTSTAVISTGRAMSAAFQATGGTSQVAQGIAQTAKAFGDLNLASGTFSASRTLLEIGKTVQDFRELRGAVGSTGGALSVVGGILRAHPLMAIASVLSVAAGAMSLFSNNTRQASREWESLAANMRKANADLATAGVLGTDPSGALRARASAIEGMYTEAAGRTGYDEARFSTATGISNALGENGPGDVVRELAAFGNPTASAWTNGGTIPSLSGATRDPSWILTSRAETLDFYRRRFVTASTMASPSPDPASVYQFGNPMLHAPGSWASITPGRDYVTQSAEQQRQVADENRRRQEESAERIARIFDGIGQTIGNVAADLANGSVSMRQAITSLAQQFMRQGLSSGMGAIFSSFGSTLAQRNPTMPGTQPRVGE